MSDIPVKCPRCRNEHMESQRSTKTGRLGLEVLVCPRCRCESYYDMRTVFAWSWASGLIEFGEAPPASKPKDKGCIVFARGPKHAMKAVLETVARHGYGSGAGQLLVPGVPEASADVFAAVDAFSAWVDECSKGNDSRHRLGVTFGRSVVPL